VSRWATISSKFAQAVRVGNEQRFEVMSFGDQIRDALIQELGCGDHSVSWYRYKKEIDPRYDSHESVNGLDDAITTTGDGWVIGLGIRVETAPNGWPKTTFVFPIEIKFLADGLRIESSLTPNAREVHAPADISALASEMADGLEHTLDNWATGSRRQRVGFDTQNAS